MTNPPPYPNQPDVPGAAGAAGAAGRPAPPKPLALAVKLMYVGAAVTVLNLAVQLTQTDAIREQIAATGDMTPEAIDTAVTIGKVFGVVVTAIAVTLWVLNAVFNARGRIWARVLATVLGSLAVLFTLFGLAQPSTPATMALSLAQLVLAAVIVWLIWRPESSRYYKAMSGPV